MKDELNTNQTDRIAYFKQVTAQAVTASLVKTDASDKVSSLSSQVLQITLAIKASGILADWHEVRKSFSKGNKASKTNAGVNAKLNGLMTKAVTVYDAVMASPSHEFTYVTGKGEKAVKHIVSLSDIKAWKHGVTDAEGKPVNMPFSISTAYAYLTRNKANEEVPIELRAIRAYQDAEGMTGGELLKFNQNLLLDEGFKANVIAQGKTILGEQERVFIESDNRKKQDDVIRLFSELPENLQKEVLAKLPSENFVGSIPYTVDKRLHA